MRPDRFLEAACGSVSRPRKVPGGVGHDETLRHALTGSQRAACQVWTVLIYNAPVLNCASLLCGKRAIWDREGYTRLMGALYSDTHPKIEQMQIELIRRMPTWRKMSMVDGLNETVKRLALAGIKQRHPTATPEQIHRMLADLMLGEELARKVYPGTARQGRGDHAR